MKFKKGTKVEVLTLKDWPSGSWRCTEIISRNSRHYTVGYEANTEVFGKPTVEKVSRKAIRPCPPPVNNVLHEFVPGDVVEVLHNYSWKMATVLNVSGHDHVVVRLFGSDVEFRANKYDVRPRLCWQDGEWIVIRKACDKYEDLKFRIPSSTKTVVMNNDHQRKLVTFVSGRRNCGNEFTRNASNVALGSQAMSLIFLKRTPSHAHPQVESHATPSRKKMKLGNKVENENAASITVDDVSVLSSVASCSVCYRNTSDNESQSSDAESCLRSEEKEVLVNEIHRLELHAYRCTLEALYESGPLSWEQELLLTNLRDSLHISTDEHLVEIRSLVSSSLMFPSLQL